MREDAPKDTQAYSALQMNEQHMVGGVSIAGECKVDMSATTMAICKPLNGENYGQLSGYYRVAEAPPVRHFFVTSLH